MKTILSELPAGTDKVKRAPRSSSERKKEGKNMSMLKCLPARKRRMGLMQFPKQTLCRHNTLGLGSIWIIKSATFFHSLLSSSPLSNFAPVFSE